MTSKVYAFNFDENVMIHTTTRRIKLIDFGSTLKISQEEVTTFYGTQKFACPEAIYLKRYYLEAQEIWALGTLLYVLLFKMDPFGSDREIVELDIAKRIERLRKGSDAIPAIYISNEACELLTALLQKNYTLRPDVREIKNFGFFSLA